MIASCSTSTSTRPSARFASSARSWVVAIIAARCLLGSDGRRRRRKASAARHLRGRPLGGNHGLDGNRPAPSERSANLLLFAGHGDERPGHSRRRRRAHGRPPSRWVSDTPAEKAACPSLRRRCTTKHRRDDDKGFYSMGRRRHAPTKSFEESFCVTKHFPRTANLYARISRMTFLKRNPLMR